MKSVGELTDGECTALTLAQGRLREAALSYAMGRTKEPTYLYQAARHFNAVVEAIGLAEYWVGGLEIGSVNDHT